MFAALLLSFQTPTVTFTADATRLEPFLQQFSKVTGAKLSAPGAMAEELICVRMVDVPLKVALDKIAAGMEATWKEQDGGLRLTRSPEQSLELRRREERYKSEVVRWGQAKIAEELKKAPKWDAEEADKLAGDVAAYLKRAGSSSGTQDDWQVRGKLEARAPYNGGLRELITLLNPSDIATITPEMRVVWSTSPNRMQYAIPQSATRVLRSMAAQYDLWRDAANRRNLKQYFKENDYRMMGFFQAPKLAGDQITKFIVSATTYGFGNGTNFDLKAVDGKGSIVFRANAALPSNLEAVFGNAERDKPTPNEPMITATPEMQALMKEAMKSQGSFGAVTLPPALRTRLLDPVTYDPIAFAGSPALIAYAETTKRNLVARVGDDLLVNFLFAMVPVPASRMRQTLETTMATEVEESDGWVIMRPKLPIHHREMRFSRSEFRTFLGLITTQRVVPLETRAYYAWKLPDERTSPLAMLIQMLLLGQPDGMNQDDHTMLKLYGALDAGQRRALVNGGLTFGSLNDVQRQILEQMVYNDRGARRISPGGPLNQVPEIESEEVTEALPNGIPSGAKIVATDVSSTVIEPKSMNPNPRMRFSTGGGMNPSAVAWDMFAKSRPDLFPQGDNSAQWSYDRVRVGRRRELQFHIDIIDGMSIYRSLRDSDLATAKEVAWSEVPDDFKKQVDSIIETYKKSYSNAKPGQFGGGGNPPVAKP